MLPAISDGLNEVERALVRAVLTVEDPRGLGTAEVLQQAMEVDHVLSLDRHLVAIQNDVVVSGLHSPLFAPVDDVLSAYLRLSYWSQSWATRYPLISALGFMGSIQGYAPADHLFTRVSASDYARATFDPESGEARVPNLLLNGSAGHSPGALGVPPHAMGEIVLVIRRLLANERLTEDQLVGTLPGPDFPTGGLLVSPREDIEALYRTGRATLTLRGLSHVIRKRDKEIVVISELPYGVALTAYLEELEEMRASANMRGVSDIVQHGEGDDGPIHLTLTGRLSSEEIWQILCKKSRFQSSIECEMRALRPDGTSAVCTLEELARQWLEPRLTRHGRAKVAHELEVVARAHGDPRRTRIEDPGFCIDPL